MVLASNGACPRDAAISRRACSTLVTLAPAVRLVGNCEIRQASLACRFSDTIVCRANVPQTDSLVMSDSGFAYSAAYSALPRRAVWLAANAEECNFQARYTPFLRRTELRIRSDLLRSETT